METQSRMVARSLVVAGLVLAGLCLAGCSDDKKEPPLTITGRVIDFEGSPVEAANVVIDFRQHVIESAAAKRAHMPLTQRADVTDSSCHNVFSWCSEPVTTFKCFNNPTCHWNEDVSDLVSAPPGLYTVEVRDCETFELDHIDTVLVEYLDIDDRLNSSMIPLAITDFAGRFAIETCQLPVGLEFRCTDDGKTTMCDLETNVAIYAWNGTLSKGQLISLDDGAIDITIQLPSK